MDRFKFLHAADIHVDSPLRGISRYEGVPVEPVRLANRTALNNLIDAAIDEQVAFLVIAGDLNDGDWDHFGTRNPFDVKSSKVEDADWETPPLVLDPMSVRENRCPSDGSSRSVPKKLG